MKRRSFLRLSAGMLAGMTLARSAPLPRVSSGRIERIDLYPSRYPMTGYFKFFAGPDGSVGRACVTIRIVTDQGEGWGQSLPIARWSGETLETATAALRDYFAPALIGHPADDIAGAHRIMDGVLAPGFTTTMPVTRAGIDIIEEKGLGWLGSGLTDPDLSLAAILHLYTAFGLTRPAALNGPQFLNASILKEPISDAGGKMSCPTGPGLGVEVDGEKLHSLTEQSGLRPIVIT